MSDHRKTEQAAFEMALQSDRYDLVTHRAYADWLTEQGRDAEAEHHRSWTVEWQQAEDRLKAFCRRVNLNYPYFLQKIREFNDIRKEGKDETDHTDETGYTDETVYTTEEEGIPCTIDTSNATMDEDMGRMWVDVATVLRIPVEEGKKDDPFTCGNNCFPVGLDWEDGQQP